MGSGPVKLLLLKFKCRREEEATATSNIFQGSSPTNWLSERSRIWIWGSLKTESESVAVMFLPERLTAVMLLKPESVSLLHVMPFHRQVGTEGTQLERRRDGSLETEALKDKRR